ncbi:MAG: ATP-dependent DNA ligase [Nocardioidaceae bacterium]
MLLRDLVATSRAVAAARSRLEKRRLLADALRAADPGEIEVVAAFLAGAPRQRRVGVGWRGLSSLPEPASVETLTVVEIDAALDALTDIGGVGSIAVRSEAVEALFSRVTADEQEFLRALIFENLRQGALDSVLLDAIAEAAEVPITEVRRAAMFSGPSGPVAAAALAGGSEALAAFRLEIGRPVRPMLASPAPSLDAAIDGVRAEAGAFAVDAKLDGIRVQIHRTGADVSVFSRSLDDLTDRLPGVVAAARSFASDRFVLDGEALALDDDGRARIFQESVSMQFPMVPRFFDLLHVDGDDLTEATAAERYERLTTLVPADLLVERLVTADPEEAAAFNIEVLKRGNEGVVVKDLSSTYAAGRRGSAWLKVKPRHTLDLVVLAVEWGSGRRHGTLSNIHLGARDGDGFVMLGKTFKGMTDRMLAWQTERFLELETRRDGHVVYVRPEQVVEIAFDGVQRSTRYPGGVALRFARVLRYRDDKTADEADTIETVRDTGRRR